MKSFSRLKINDLKSDEQKIEEHLFYIYSVVHYYPNSRSPDWANFHFLGGRGDTFAGKVQK
jgi:hypothetical protein